MKRTMFIIVAAVVLLSLAPSAQAHSEVEIEKWMEIWSQPLNPPFGPRDLAAYDEEKGRARKLKNMRDRHPCSHILQTWTDEACSPRRVQQATPRTLAPAASAPAPASGVYRGMGNGGSDVERYRSLVAGYFGGETELALCIVRFESGGNPNAINQQGSGAAGLFQIMPFWWERYGGDRYDPATNVRVAKLIRDSQGWTAWSVYKKGQC